MYRSFNSRSLYGDTQRPPRRHKLGSAIWFAVAMAVLFLTMVAQQRGADAPLPFQLSSPGSHFVAVESAPSRPAGTFFLQQNELTADRSTALIYPQKAQPTRVQVLLGAMALVLVYMVRQALRCD